jgi:hypothetical protein
MSDLAYNLSGEQFELPGAAVGWRVRKLKAKGAPEVVYGREGIPLILPVDADMDDLRREARHEGKYRLDPLDEHNRSIAGCPAGYVCIHEGEPTALAEPTALVAKPAPVVATADQALVEAMRIQAALAQSVVEKFAMMLEASAILLRAAQNAGMPQRLPRFFLDAAENENEGELQADPEPQSEPAQAAPKATGLPAIIETIVAAGTPALINAIANGKLKIPGGLGALIDCRRAVPKDSGAAAPATSTPGVVPAPGLRGPAPAPSVPVVLAPVPSPTAPASVASATASSGPAAGAPTAAVADVPEGLPTIDEPTMRHFQSILSALTLHEQMLAQALNAELTPMERRAWIQELKSLSIEAGAAKIRGVLGTAPDTGGSTGNGLPPGSGSSGAVGNGGVS